MNTSFITYSCQDYENKESNEKLENTAIAFGSDDCVKSIFKTNEFLRSIHIEIANVCNERCVHCYIPLQTK